MIRKYNQKDYDYLYKALSDEGFTKDQMTFETDHTYITDKGFFSYRMVDSYPRLAHLYLNKKDRTYKNASDLIKALRKILIENEHLFFIAESPKEKPYMERFIKYIKGVKYLEINGDSFFYVPVFGRFK